MNRKILSEISVLVLDITARLQVDGSYNLFSHTLLISHGDSHVRKISLLFAVFHITTQVRLKVDMIS